MLAHPCKWTFWGLTDLMLNPWAPKIQHWTFVMLAGFSSFPVRCWNVIWTIAISYKISSYSNPLTKSVCSDKTSRRKKRSTVSKIYTCFVLLTSLSKNCLKHWLHWVLTGIAFVVVLIWHNSLLPNFRLLWNFLKQIISSRSCLLFCSQFSPNSFLHWCAVVREVLVGKSYNR